MYNKLLQAAPENADALHLLGIRAYQTGKNDIAVDLISRAVALKPDNKTAWYDLGLALHVRGDISGAIRCYKRAVELKPDYYEAHTNLGIALQNNGDFTSSLECLKRSLEINPDYPLTHNNLGITLQHQNKFSDAIMSYKTAIKLNPDYYEAYNNLGYVLHASGRISEAISSYEAALKIKPDYKKAYVNMGNCLKDLGMIEDAIECYRKAMAIDPNDPLPFADILFVLHYSQRYDPKEVFEEHLKWAGMYAEPLKSKIRPHNNDRDPDRRLRIGYVSPDFKAHSVAYFIGPVIALHGRDRFEVFCYDTMNRPDEVTARIRRDADQWRDIASMSDDDAAELIRRDRIDILVELAGHSAQNRLLLFARKPAPVQVAWLGYPDTTGLDTIDYRITDAHADPVGMTDSYYTEELVRLSESFLCYRPPLNTPEVSELPAARNGKITFASFNNFAKVTPEMIAVWSEILTAFPASSLVLKIRSAGEEGVRSRLLDMFAKNGVSAGRIELHKTVGSTTEHLNYYNRVDIALDTFPYNGTTTTCEALWMGVPVVTLAGSAHMSRVGVSILANMGLSDLIARTPDEYVKIAVCLAGNIERLKTLRSGMRERMSSSVLSDAPRFTAALEEAYRRMWTRWSGAPHEVCSTH